MLDDLADSFINLASRQVKDEEGSSPQLTKIFISFQLFSLFGIIIVLATVLGSRSTPRHATWFSFAISWIISTASYSLLFWGGNLSGPQPPYILCLIQGIMIYSAPPLTAATTLALVIQIWVVVRSVAFTSPKAGRMPVLLLTALLVVPYLIYVTILIGTLVVGWRDPLTVRRVGSAMYCSFSNRVPGRLSTILVALIMLPAAVFEVLICKALRQQWTLFGHQTDALSMALRVVAFTFVGISAIALSVVFFFMIHHGSDLTIVISIVPVFAVLIFGSQADVLRVWMFWKKRPTPVTTEKEAEAGPTITPDNRSVVIDISA